MESKKKKNGASYFQMPLHYPRYSKKDYENMPEWKLDRLLTEYGLQAMGDLAYKREYAMGAFLWPEMIHSATNKSQPPMEKGFGRGFAFNKNKLA